MTTPQHAADRFAAIAEEVRLETGPIEIHLKVAVPPAAVTGLRPVAQPDDRFDSTRVGLDHLSFGVSSLRDLEQAADSLNALGIQNGGVVELPELSIAILSFQDPDDINLELVTAMHS